MSFLDRFRPYWINGQHRDNGVFRAARIRNVQIR